jgi:hypothetical protein
MSSEEDWTDRGTKNYRSKTDWMVVRNKIYPVSERMQLNNLQAGANYQMMINIVRAKLSQLGVNPEFMGFYFAYSEALWKSQFKLAWMVDRIREHAILRDKWEKRGFDPKILDELDKILIFNKAAPK